MTTIVGEWDLEVRPIQIHSGSSKSTPMTNLKNERDKSLDNSNNK